MATTKFDVKHIENPQFLKTLNKDELHSLASDIRQEIIEATAHYGGHLSSNLSSKHSTTEVPRHSAAKPQPKRIAAKEHSTAE